MKHRRKAVLLSIIFVLLISSLSFFTAAEEIKVHFIDVGQGDAILIQSEQADVLIDGGDRWDWVGEKLVSNLDEANVVDLQAIFSTHPHADHIGGLPVVMEEFPVEKIYDSGRVHTTQTYINYLELIDDLDIPFFTPRRGEIIDIEDLQFHVLHPGPEVEDYSLNNASLVLRLEHGEVSFLFTGDAEKEAEIEMLQTEQKLKSTILKAGHHGSSTSTTDQFLEEVNPEVAVIQVGADNRYGHPHREVMLKLKREEIEIFRNDWHGDIVIKSDGKDYVIKTSREAEEDVEESLMVNINSAPFGELKTLHGIGPALVERIIDYREKHGAFSSIEEIMEVPGIGPATFARIEDEITVGDLEE